VLYDDALLDEATGGGLDGSGGSATGGDGTVLMPGDMTGGTGNGPAAGGNGNLGGAPGAGGSESGSTGGEGTGAADGSGGSVGEEDVLDAMDHPGEVLYSGFPFSGEWGRYACGSIAWEVADAGGMFLEDPDDAGNNVLHVQGAGPSGCWGGGVLASLNPTWQPVDLSGYSGIRFRAKGGGTGSVITAKFQDAVSHETSPGAGPCADEDCEAHLFRSGSMSSDWKEFDFPLTQFVMREKGSTTAPNLEMVYAIHFSHTPSGDDISFFVDDVRFYK